MADDSKKIEFEINSTETIKHVSEEGKPRPPEPSKIVREASDRTNIVQAERNKEQLDSLIESLSTTIEDRELDTEKNPAFLKPTIPLLSPEELVPTPNVLAAVGEGAIAEGPLPSTIGSVRASSTGTSSGVGTGIGTAMAEGTAVASVTSGVGSSVSSAFGELAAAATSVATALGPYVVAAGLVTAGLAGLSGALLVAEQIVDSTFKSLSQQFEELSPVAMRAKGIGEAELISERLRNEERVSEDIATVTNARTDLNTTFITLSATVIEVIAPTLELMMETLTLILDVINGIFHVINWLMIPVNGIFKVISALFDAVDNEVIRRREDAELGPLDKLQDRLKNPYLYGPGDNNRTYHQQQKLGNMPITLP